MVDGVADRIVDGTLGYTGGSASRELRAVFNDAAAGVAPDSSEGVRPMVAHAGTTAGAANDNGQDREFDMQGHALEKGPIIALIRRRLYVENGLLAGCPGD